MNIVFFGSSGFAVPSLEALLASEDNVSCVVTQPDRKRGRGLHLEGTLVKDLASKSGIPVYQPEVVNARESVEFLKNLSSDLFIVVSYGQILSQDVLSIPQIFSINAHASLLPKYRGAGPISRAIINGEISSGVTIMKMVEKMDAGPIILQEAVIIEDNETALTLEDKLSRKAAELLINSIKLIKNKAYNLIPQEENKASLAPKLKKSDGLINWQMPAQDINNLVRGCISWPGAFTYYNNKLLKIYKARVSSRVLEFSGSPAGEIIKIDKEGIVVAAGKDSLVIEELQIEGKRRMRVGEFIAGHKIKQGDMLG